MKEPEIHTDETFLRNLPVTGGFTVPEGYFQEQRTRLMFRIRRNGYELPEMQVPEGYFENSRNRILQKTTLHKKASFTLLRNPLMRYAAAASVILVSGIAFMFLRMDKQQSARNISANDVINYLEVYGTSDLSSAELVQLIPTSQMPTTAEENYLIQQTDNTLTFEEL